MVVKLERNANSISTIYRGKLSFKKYGKVARNVTVFRKTATFSLKYDYKINDTRKRFVQLQTISQIMEICLMDVSIDSIQEMLHAILYLLYYFDLTSPSN